MKFSSIILSLAALGSAAPNSPPPATDSEAAAALRIRSHQATYQKYIKETIKTRKTGCTSKDIVKRREWGELSKPERLDYINAVYCMQRKPARSPREQIPGARTRYDDFVGAHIQETLNIHIGGRFLGFHRYYIWLFEKALREECGYRGYLPYWDWTISWEDPRKSTVFDGSPFSLGGNGASIPHGPLHWRALGLPDIYLPPATGGGCVDSGPFQASTWTINLGPVSNLPAGPNDGLGYNPRCLQRDLSLEFSAQAGKPSAVAHLLETCTNLECWDSELQSPNGTHFGGHATVGLSMFDAYASPGDPSFWLHHAQVDRMWTIWQNKEDQEARKVMTSMTETPLNNPPSPRVTLNTTIEFGVLDSSKKVGELVSTIDGPFCYIYE
ncbi:hypothetical protein B0T20DRAFT_462703 [Sordaria brevicollis]|uniref:Tyrosinase copper-binding domain-containing protein n=1 Tax=Sordaria brevicollis TaxID=83679 RepID=A0AAE0U9X9_SORBR|nr:hypothetical protein B0T20DRAFT_462703 [Sordaria brevicollis]